VGVAEKVVIGLSLYTIFSITFSTGTCVVLVKIQGRGQGRKGDMDRWRKKSREIEE